MGKLKTQFQKLADIDIAYTECGEGPVLILLHGNSESKRIFYEYQTRHFAAYHTYALDSRGHGESVSEDASYSIEQYSEDVIAFCKARGIAKAKVIGYSDGGNIALYLALKAPELFGRLVAVSPNYLASGTIEGWLKLIKAFHGVFRALGMRKSAMRFELMLNDIGLAREDLRAIRTGVAIMYASDDMIKEEHILDIAGSIPGSVLRKIGGCSHLSILKQTATIDFMKEYLGA
jgi:pimeloyl-ACP methyl ester carboxylesterase